MDLRVAAYAVIVDARGMLLAHWHDGPRAAWTLPGGGLEAGEDPADAVVREVREETGIDARAAGCALRDWELENSYTIYPAWQHRYAPGVWTNRERVLGLRVPSYMPVCLNPREHTAHAWHDWPNAAEHCFSASNAEAILLLPRFDPHVFHAPVLQQT